MKFLFLLLYLTTTDLAAREKIVTLYQMDLRPAYILDGPFKGQGLQDTLDQWFIEALEKEGYEVNIQLANISRIINDLESMNNVICGGLLLYPENTPESFTPTYAHSIVIPVGIITLSKNIEHFKPFIDSSGKICLSSTINETHLALGTAAGRPYYKSVDSLLAAHKNNPNILFRHGEDISAGLFHMLANERIDYTIMYPWEATYVQRELGYADIKTTFIPIKGVPSYIFAVGAAPKNSWGRAIIEIMNRVVLERRDTPYYHKIKEFWLDEEQKRAYRAFVYDFFKTSQD